MNTFLSWLYSNIAYLAAIVIFLSMAFHIVRLLGLRRKDDCVLVQLGQMLHMSTAVFMRDITLPIRKSKTTQLDGLVITHSAIFIIAIKHYSSPVRVNDGSHTWHRLRGDTWITMPSPFIQQNAHAGAVMKALGNHLVRIERIVIVTGPHPLIHSRLPSGHSIFRSPQAAAEFIRTFSRVSVYDCDEVNDMRHRLNSNSLPRGVVTDLGHIITINKSHNRQSAWHLIVAHNMAVTVKGVWGMAQAAFKFRSKS